MESKGQYSPEFKEGDIVSGGQHYIDKNGNLIITKFTCATYGQFHKVWCEHIVYTDRGGLNLDLTTGCKLWHVTKLEKALA